MWRTLLSERALQTPANIFPIAPSENQIPQLSHEDIGNYTTERIMIQGASLYGIERKKVLLWGSASCSCSRHAVSSLVVFASLQKLHSQVSHEIVKLAFNGRSIIGASCSCNPEGRKSFYYLCKHAVATLMQYSADPSAALPGVQIAKQVEQLPREALIELAVQLLTHQEGVRFFSFSLS